MLNPKLSLFIVSMILSFACPAQDLKLTFGADLPLNSYQPATIIAKLEKAFAMSGVQFNAISVPSNRSLQLAHKGVIDGDLSRVSNLHEITGHRYSNLVRIDHVMFSVWIAIFTNNPDIEIDNLSDISQYTVCFTNGRKYFDDVFAPLVQPDNLVKLNSDLQAFELLAKKRVDIVITTSREGNQLIQDWVKFDQIREVKKLIKLPVYSYIHKKHSALLDDLTRNLAKVEQQQELQVVHN
ncbi:hypothetical protein C2869_03760 [Saccharobesus litoralis]|uniref:Uncharacterized protein n=1 Tax=Saccharobesus litoralis TaxID=2172099 RepID=A0A2S0VN22_9ALTE|nr:transporter substrate-binding domain-containing protein [Saccharobesus litoralis]AWB65605.1 hypothetical protein C2869_03760 [Saccharobesus litoralis]